MTERKIICKILTGSHLYGTNRPDSDLDYTGVFLPSTRDLLSLQSCPSEYTESVKTSTGDRNTFGDVDCKFFSLQRFLNLAAQGQSVQLEMLFAPELATIIATDEWRHILANKHLFFSKKSISPFVGFALAQSHKATVKGDNLKKLTAVSEGGKKLTSQVNLGLKDFCTIIMSQEDPKKGALLFPTGDHTYQTLDVIINDHGFTMVSIAGRNYDINLRAKTFLNNIDELIARYGTRSKAAAEVGKDPKSYMHAYRLMSEAKEFLETQHITLPRPDTDFLKLIRNNQYEADYFEELTAKIDELRQEIEPRSSLPDKPNYSKIEKLCQEMLYQHLFTTR